MQNSGVEGQGDRPVNGQHREPVAIVGIGCRFPGSADNPEKFWDLLKLGADALADIPPERWNAERFYHPDPTKPGKIYIRKGGFLRQRVDEFDPLFFGISPREALYIDPQQRMLLEVAWEALEDAGEVPKSLAGSDTGVYIGGFTLDSMVLQMSPLNRENIDSHYGATAATMTMLANRLSYTFDFRGPSITVDTACSSSLVAFHYACQGLWGGECSLALAGGVNVMLAPEFPMVMCKGHFLAPDGRSKSFDERADGYGRGEGCGIVVLKPLSAALKDGNEIYALARNTGVNQDGRTEGITVPNAAAQEALIRDVYGRANVGLHQVRYVEAHGTGTPVGDPIEAAVLGKTVGANRGAAGPCVIGSVKSSIGHLEAAAGVAGVIKASLCLKHRLIPPQANLQNPNPRIPFADYGLRLPTALEPMPYGEGPAYAGVNSFGYGGTNAHALLQDAPDSIPATGAAGTEDGRPYVLPISARSEGALQTLARSFAGHLARPGAPPLRDLCYSASVRRSHFEHRLAIAAETTAGILEQLQAFLSGERAEHVAAGKLPAEGATRPVFVFSGMGPQWWAMGRELLRDEPLFRETVGTCDELFRKTAGWSILAEMTAEESRSRMAETEIAQPANFVLQVGLAALWQNWGIQPAAIVGHSVGEVAAAYVSGALDLPDAVRVIYHRSRLQQTASGAGKMLAVSLPEQEAKALLEGRAGAVSIAAINSPTSVTLSGDPAPLEELAAELERRNVFHSFLRVTVAYHSHQMERLQQELEQSLAGICARPPAVPLYSTVTGRAEQGALCDPPYWYRNIRCPVLFAEAVSQLVSAGHTLFLELGPHPVLSSSIGECLLRSGARGEVLTSLRRKEPEALNLRRALGRLYVAGCSVDWSKLYSGGARYTRLPTYAWQKERYWSESERNSAERVTAVVHPLLGVPVSGAATIWESDLNAHYLAYLADHVIDNVPLFPAAAFVEGGFAIRALADGSEPAVIEDLDLSRALTLEPAHEVRLRWDFDKQSREYRVHSRVLTQGSQWTPHASARISPAPPGAPQHVEPPARRARAMERIDSRDLYARMRAHGLHYGPRFQTIRELYRGRREVLARLEPAPGTETRNSGYHLHPALLDGAFQSLIACLDADEEGASAVYVPVRIRSIRRHSGLEAPFWCYGRLTKVSGKTIEGDLLLVNDEGKVAVEVLGFRCAALQASQAEDATQIQRWTYALQWEEAPVAAASGQSSRWLLLVDQGGVGAALAECLRAQGAAEVIQAADLADALRGADTRNGTSVVCLWGLDVSSGADPAGIAGTARALALVQALAESAGPECPRLYLVTRGAQQVRPEDPVNELAQAPLAGLARVVASEYPALKCTVVDMDPGGAAEASRQLAAVLLCNSPEDAIALRGSRRYVHRITRASTKELEEASQARRLLPAVDGNAFTLEIGKQGSMDSLRFRAIARRKPGPGEVEIKIHAAALNFKDVLKVLGVLPEEAYEGTFHGRGLGMEAAGTVTAVGEGVRKYKPGDAIVASLRGSFSSHVCVPADALFGAPQPDRLSPAEAAGIPVAFLTAYYALHNVAHLALGEKVLIHAATGGVGLAAIQVARWLGAEIFATAGSPAKRDYLRSLGIEHIWDSRSLEFADGILSATGGRGVDVVLNSISGEALWKSLSVMAPMGRFVEIGKRDIMENNRLPMLPFNSGLTFSAIDLDHMMVERPDLIQATLQEVWERLSSGDFTPTPVKVFRAAEVSEAFRYMAQSRQIGKIVVDMEDVAGVSLWPRAGTEEPIRADATYLITGGFGGIGLELARWLAGRGARHLVLAGRRGAASPKARQVVDELGKKGVSVMAVAADISEESQVVQLLGDVARTMPPVRGVFHAAAVLDDGLLSNLDQRRFENVMAPKALGAWWLDRHTRCLPLDFFVLFSSVAAWVGNPGQANYVAANAFLDALAEHRRAQGLPATSISWGAVADAGMVAENEQVAARLASVGIRPLPISSVLEAVASVLRWNPVHLGVMEVDWARWSQVQPGAKTCPRFSRLLAELETGGQGLDSRNIRVALAALVPEKRRDRLAAAIAELVADALHMPAAKMDLHQPFTEMGIDSLLGVELQTSIAVKLGVEVSLLELMKSKGITGLAGDLLQKMKLGAGAASEGAAMPPSAGAATA